jgi:hypothetical protein
MTTATLNNGRKTLASQIDRLDSILDGLAENLNDAVATAAAEGVKAVVSLAVQEAVHSALVEVLSSAEIQKRLAASQAMSIPTPVPLLVRLAVKARSCWSWLVCSAKATASKMVTMARAASAKVRTVERSLAAATSAKVQKAREQVVRRAKTGWMLATALAAIAKRYYKQLALAIGVGILVGIACYAGGREIAAISCGLAGFVGSLASDAWSRLRRRLPHWLPCTS